jgi:hypothetical protein
MAGSITDWPKLFRQAYKHASSGGWIEIQEYAIQMHVQEGDEHLPKTIAFWLAEMDKASTIIGRTMNVVEKLKDAVIEAGFTSVKEDVYKVIPSDIAVFVLMIGFKRSRSDHGRKIRG